MMVDIQRLRRELEGLRHAHGIGVGDVMWFMPAYDAWREAMDRMGQVDDGTLARLAAGMDASLAMRDALLLAMIDDPGRAMVERLVADPHADDTRGMVVDTITRMFEDDALRPDVDRCEWMLNVIERMVGLCAGTPAVTARLLSLAAYVAWWMGDEKTACGYVRRTVQADPDTGMAGIVEGMILRRIRPAWRH